MGLLLLGSIRVGLLVGLLGVFGGLSGGGCGVGSGLLGMRLGLVIRVSCRGFLLAITRCLRLVCSRPAITPSLGSPALRIFSGSGLVH